VDTACRLLGRRVLVAAWLPLSACSNGLSAGKDAAASGGGHQQSASGSSAGGNGSLFAMGGAEPSSLAGGIGAGGAVSMTAMGGGGMSSLAGGSSMVGGVTAMGGGGMSSLAAGGSAGATVTAQAAAGTSGAGGAVISGMQLWEQQRARLLAIIGRPQVPLAAIETAQPDDTGLLVHDFSFASDSATRISGTSFAPKKAGPLPAVIFLHGTGGSRQDGFPLLRTLAQKGFFGLAIDARYHGAGLGTGPYFNAIYNSYVTGVGHPFLYDTVWDVMRLLDYLDQHAGVDPTRIGLVGESKGGMETYLTAAVEPRVAVAVPWISVESFGWALDNNQWQARVGSIQGAFDQAAAHDGVPIDVGFVRKFYDRVVPGIYTDLDGPRMVPAIAPRPLLAINGDMDPRTPMGGLLLCDAAGKAAYAGTAAQFEQYLEPNTGHAVTTEATTRTVAWFVEWLKP
jgi:pimeloyl-ACP methyl ester carboxylesterase